MKGQLFISVFALLCLFSLISADDAFVTIYWGQDGEGIEPDLATVCQNDKVGVVNLAFLNVFFNADDDNLPGLNFADHCGTTFPGHQLLHCPQIASDIVTCQKLGVKILLSLGGAAGVYGFTSASQADSFATTIWNMFLGGHENQTGNYTLRPFDGAILDGVDLDIEGGSPDYYDTFITSLRDLMGDSYLVSAAPQCPYPDAYVGPTIASVGYLMDYLWIQFYNNYCELDTSFFNFNAWINGTADNIQLLIGLPAAQGAAGSGYISISELEKVLPSVSGNERFGGIMLWDAGYNQLTNYSENAARLLDDY